MSTRRVLAVPLGVIAAVLLFLLVNPWVTPEPGSTLNQLVTAGFWVSFLALLVVLFQMRKEPGGETIEIEGPAFTRFLFGNSRAGLFWLPIRLFVGFSWLEAGYHKFSGTGWMDGGAALKGFWEKAVAVPDSRQPGHHLRLVSLLHPVPARQQRVHLVRSADHVRRDGGRPGLLFGCLTGIAAFFGALMNMSFLLAGSASTNPVLFTLAIGLMLAWKVAGYYGLDRYVLPLLGTPWHRGTLAPPAAR